MDREGLEDDFEFLKAQDFHSMLEVVLKSYVQLQESGFLWDLTYKQEVFKDIEFVLFNPFVRYNGEEGDTLCGKYTSRTANVAQLCRYCECPTEKTDDPYAEFPPKTTRKIGKLVHRNDTDILQQLSQQNI